METGTISRVTPLREPPEPPDPPPANTEAEQALLGAILVNNGAYSRVSGFLLPEHFANGVHGRIFAAIGTLIDRGDIADPVRLKNLFDQDGALTQIGGSQYLARLAESAVTIINAEHYGRTIHDLFLRRELITIGQDIVSEAFKHDLDVSAEEQIQAADQKLVDLQTRSLGAQAEDKTVGMAAAEALRQSEEAYKRADRLAGLPTGFYDLDQKLGGLIAEELIVIAGRPAMGKSAIAEQIAIHLAQACGVPVGMFQLEQSAEVVAQRAMARVSRVSAHDQRRGEMDMLGWDAVLDAAGRLGPVPLYIDDRPGLSLAQIRARARLWVRRRGVKLVAVDHLNISGGQQEGAWTNRVGHISAMTAGLKQLAKELGVPVLLLCQLSRSVEQRENHRPMLSDLRDSGSVEQDADVVMFVFREEYYLSQREPTRRDGEADDKFNDRYDRWREALERAYGMAEIIIAKQRHGPTATVKLHFDGEMTEFDNLAAPAG